jgi:hypothetical protein
LARTVGVDTEFMKKISLEGKGAAALSIGFMCPPGSPEGREKNSQRRTGALIYCNPFGPAARGFPVGDISARK